MKNDNENETKWRELLEKALASGKDGRLAAMLANIELEKIVRNRHRAGSRKNETYIINSERYKQAIASARKLLELDKGTRDDERHQKFVALVMVLTAAQLVNRPTSEGDITEAILAFQDFILDVLHEAGLGDEWLIFVAAHVVNGEPPREKYFGATQPVSIEDIDNSGEVLIRLRPGLSKEDYERAWQVVGELLGKPKRLQKSYTNSEQNKALYEAKQDGKSYGQLADEYFPKIDKVLAVDRIKKIIKRERERYEAGTKLDT